MAPGFTIPKGHPVYKPWVLYTVRDGALKSDTGSPRKIPAPQVSDQELAANSASEVIAENIAEFKSKKA